MIDVHQNAALSESFEGDRSHVIGNCCNVHSSFHFTYFRWINEKKLQIIVKKQWLTKKARGLQKEALAG